MTDINMTDADAASVESSSVGTGFADPRHHRATGGRRTRPRQPDSPGYFQAARLGRSPVRSVPGERPISQAARAAVGPVMVAVGTPTVPV